MFALDPDELREFFPDGGLLEKQQYGDFFDLNNWVNMDKDVLIQGGQNGGMLNLNFPGTTDEMDALWAENFLKGSKGLPGVD